MHGGDLPDQIPQVPVGLFPATSSMAAFGGYLCWSNTRLFA
jgi:hypothetical protein